MKYQEIVSKDNSLVKKIIKLAKDSNYRRLVNQSIVSSEKLVLEAKKYDCLECVLIAKSALEQYKYLTLQQNDLPIYILADEIIDKINLVESVVDIIGIIKTRTLVFDSALMHQDCLILENIADPGNMGTILRLAGATGIKNIIISEGSVDVYSPKVLRSSAGIQFGLNLYLGMDLFKFIHNYAGNVFATIPRNGENLYRTNLNTQIAWVFGNESSGITSELLNVILHKVTIPMENEVESLNVAMAATVCLFEMLRQRKYQ